MSFTDPSVKGSLLVRVVEASGKTQDQTFAWDNSVVSHLAVTGAFVKGMQQHFESASLY